MAEVQAAEPDPAGTSAATSDGGADVLVVGAGVAGARTCERLRAEGFAGRIVLVGGEPDLPYDRPPLTSSPGSDTDLARTMDIDVRVLADEVRLGTRVLSIEATAGDTGGWTVSLSDDATPSDDASRPVRLGARVVVAATGASPLLPTGWERASLLHTRPQADRLWDAVGAGTGLVVVGGGWIGCEVSRTAAGRGASVVLLEAGDQLLPGRVPRAAAERVAQLLAGVGVEVRTRQAVAAVAPDERGSIQVRTPGGPVPGEVVLAALGVRPESAWLPAEAPRSAVGAVLTDEWGRTALPGLFALGDVAARWSPRAGRHLPGGHWTEAFHCAESVAPAIAAWLAAEPGSVRWTDPVVSQPGAAQPDDPIPYTFSDLGEQRLLVLGDAAGGGSEVWRDQGSGWTVYVLDELGRLAGVVALDRPRDVMAARKAMRSAPRGRPVVDVSALADPTAPPARCFPVPRASAPEP